MRTHIRRLVFLAAAMALSALPLVAQVAEAGPFRP